MMSIGARLRELLEDNKMTQTELAMKLDISLSTLNGYITNYREPDIHTLSRLAKELNTTTDYLISGVEPSSTAQNVYQEKVKVIAHNEGVALTKEQEAAIARYMKFILAEDGSKE